MSQAISGVESQAAPAKKVMLGLAAVFISYFLATFLTFGLNIASPMIAADLNGMDLFSWAISLPALAMAFATLLFGKLSDMYGRRTMLLISLAFTLTGSILAAISQTFVFNIVARVIVTIGFGSIPALCFSVIGDMFTPVERSKWTGLLNISAGVAATVGNVLPGIITDNLSWRYFFWVIVPVAAACGILVTMGVPGRAQKSAHTIDYIGAILVAIASSAMILGFSFADRHPWISFHVLGLLVVSLVFWFLFIRIERSVKEPILDPQVFTNRTFLTAAAAAFLSFFGVVGIMNYFPLFLQSIQGTSAKLSGAVLTPFTVFMSFIGVPAGLLIAKTKRYKWMFILSYSILTAAVSCLIFFNQTTPIWLGVVIMVLGGFGAGALPTTNILVVQFALPVRLRGISVAAIFFTVALGTASAPAILGPAMNATYQKKLEAMLPSDLYTHIEASALESIADPGVLMSTDAFSELKNTFLRVEDNNPALFDQTVQAIRSALQSGLKVLFSLGAVALLIALLFIITIPEVSMDTEVRDKKDAR